MSKQRSIQQINLYRAICRDAKLPISERGVHLYGGALRTARSINDLVAVVSLSEDHFQPYAFLRCGCFYEALVMDFNEDEIYYSAKNLTFCGVCNGVRYEG